MSPKKAVNNPTIKRNNAERITRRTVRKEKSKSCMPANITVSIPLTQTIEDGLLIPIVKGRRPPQFKKHLDVGTKVELANDVIKHQLVKEKASVMGYACNQMKPSEQNNIKIVKSRKRGRPKKVVSDFFQNKIVVENNNPEHVVSSTASNMTEMKAPVMRPLRRILTRKRLADSTENETMKRTKVANETTSTDKLTAEIKLEIDSDVINDQVIEPYTNAMVVLPEPIIQNPPSARKRKPYAKHTPKSTAAEKQPVLCRKRASKGKKETLEESSILTTLEPKKEDKNDTDVPGPVESRKSSVSSNSTLSWTKDISSSSTCITVSSNDFVRINKKLPIIKLTNIDNKVTKRHYQRANETADHADDSSNSSDSICSKNDKQNSESVQDSVDVNSLQLSISSPTNSRVSQLCNKQITSDYTKTTEKLILSIKNIDLEILNWIGSDNEEINQDLTKFKEKMLDILDNEFGVLTLCRRLKEIEEPSQMEDITDKTCISKPAEVNNTQEDSALVEDIHTDVEFVKPGPSRKLSSITENISNASPRDDSSEDETRMDVITNKNYQYYDHHDDDDALSLFAESITGIESSKVNSSAASAVVTNTRPPHEVEEYVPKPVREDFVPNTEKQTYCPTRIRENPEVMASKIQIICEKQNADSTSIYKQSNSTDDTESYQDFTENADLYTRISPQENIQKPRLMDSFFESMPKLKSVVFGNLCFYNLMNCCRKIFFGNCRYLHKIPSSAEIKEKLCLLDERTLIQEYLLVRKWRDLRRRYGLCYVEEAAKRGLTRILVEMSYDFIVNARNDSDEDKRLRVNTIEITLLHLNAVDLSICEDLLKLTIQSYTDKVNRTLLCDVFMATMSITQNFSRFKVVFLNLTYFMVDNDRIFNKDVVEHILERVCILPFEEPIARALIQMMRLTKPDIFKNSMIGHFEKQISVDKDVFAEFMMLKNQCAFKSMLALSMVSPSPTPNMEQTPPVRADGGEGQPPAASPDTTNIDSMNKTTEEHRQPIITRTTGMNPPIIFSRNPVGPGPNRAQVNSGPNSAHDSPGSNRTYDNTGSNNAHDNPGPNRLHESPGPNCVNESPGPSPTLNSSGTSEKDPTVNQIFRKWRNRAIIPHVRPPPMADVRPMVRAPVLTPLRHPRPYMKLLTPQRMPFNQRLVTFKSPTNFMKRQPGPQY